MQKCCDLRASEDALEGELEILNCILNKHFYRMSQKLLVDKSLDRKLHLSLLLHSEQHSLSSAIRNMILKR